MIIYGFSWGNGGTWEEGEGKRGSGGEWGFVVQKRRRAQCVIEVSLAGVRRAIGQDSELVAHLMGPRGACGGGEVCRSFKMSGYRI